MNFLDKLAEENYHLIKGDKIVSFDDEMRSILCKTFVPSERIAFKKKAFSSDFGRVEQVADLDVHQNDATPNVWITKKGKLVRVTPKFIKLGAEI